MSLVTWEDEDLTRQVLIGQWCHLSMPKCGKVCILACATLLMSALPMPFPERSKRGAHGDMLWLAECSSGNQKQRITWSCTSELWHHVEILHKKSSALPWAVGEEVKCVAYLHVAWEQNNVPLVHMGTTGGYISSKQIWGICSSGMDGVFFVCWFSILNNWSVHHPADQHYLWRHNLVALVPHVTEAGRGCKVMTGWKQGCGMEE